jgi:hypothetical protein
LSSAAYSIQKSAVESNTAQFGIDVYISSPDLSATTTMTSLPFYRHSTYKPWSLSGITHPEPGAQRIDLHTILVNRDPTISLSTQGSDSAETDCHVDRKCLTIAHGLIERVNQPKQIEIAEWFTFSESLMLDDDNEFEIGGVQTISDLALYGNATVQTARLFTCRGACLFELFRFKHPATYNHHTSVFSQTSGGTVTITHSSLACSVSAWCCQWDCCST